MTDQRSNVMRRLIILLCGSIFMYLSSKWTRCGCAYSLMPKFKVNHLLWGFYDLQSVLIFPFRVSCSLHCSWGGGITVTIDFHFFGQIDNTCFSLLTDESENFVNLQLDPPLTIIGLFALRRHITKNFSVELQLQYRNLHGHARG